MKKWMTILLAVAMTLSFASCGQTIEEGTSSSEESSSAISSESSSESQEESESTDSQQTVEVTLPSTMVTDETPTDLTQEQKDMGYTELKKNEDGSLTYVIDADQYDATREKAKEQAKSDLDGMKTDSKYSTIQDVTYNDDLTEITLVVTNQLDFEQNMEDTFAILNAGLTASTYHALDGNSSQKVTVSVKDAQTGTVFNTMAYPDALNS
jgi:hypothetical protein